MMLVAGGRGSCGDQLPTESGTGGCTEAELAALSATHMQVDCSQVASIIIMVVQVQVDMSLKAGSRHIRKSAQG